MESFFYFLLCHWFKQQAYTPAREPLMNIQILVELQRLVKLCERWRKRTNKRLPSKWNYSEKRRWHSIRKWQNGTTMAMTSSFWLNTCAWSWWKWPISHGKHGLLFFVKTKLVNIWLKLDKMVIFSGRGPLKTTMDVINAAKKISEAGNKLDKLTREIADQCPESSTKKDLLAYLQRIALYCHQIQITSKVKADVQNISGELIVSGVSISFVITTIHMKRPILQMFCFPLLVGQCHIVDSSCKKSDECSRSYSEILLCCIHKIYTTRRCHGKPIRPIAINH